MTIVPESADQLNSCPASIVEKSFMVKSYNSSLVLCALGIWCNIFIKLTDTSYTRIVMNEE